MVLPKLDPLPVPDPEDEDPEEVVSKVVECTGVEYDDDKARTPVVCGYRARLEFNKRAGRKSVSLPPCPECGNGAWFEEA